MLHFMRFHRCTYATLRFQDHRLFFLFFFETCRIEKLLFAHFTSEHDIFICLHYTHFALILYNTLHHQKKEEGESEKDIERKIHKD